MASVLKDKVFISTRPQGKSKELQDILHSQGAFFYELPMIELTKTDQQEEVNNTLNNLHKYTHIAFTSANGFCFFYDKISKAPNYKEIIKNIKIASIGYKTSEYIKAKDLNIDFDASAKTGEEFADKLAIHLQSAKANVLWPTGNLSPSHLIKKLENVAPVYRLNIYKNIIPKIIEKELLHRIEKEEYDMIIISSPSAFNNLYKLIPNNKLNITCIGNITAAAVLKKGISPLAIAKEPNSMGIYNALSNYYSHNLLTK